MTPRYLIKFEVIKKWWMSEYRVRIMSFDNIILCTAKETFPHRIDAYEFIKKIKEHSFNAPINFICDN